MSDLALLKGLKEEIGVTGIENRLQEIDYELIDKDPRPGYSSEVGFYRKNNEHSPEEFDYGRTMFLLTKISNYSWSI